MRIRYTLHALERIKQREIEREQIIECLQEPDKVMEKNNIFQCVKKINKKLLIVVYKKNDDILIITAFKTKKIKKYL